MSTSAAGAPLLEVQQLGKRYRLPRRRLFERQPTVQALAGLSFTLQSGRSLGIVGESGSGKSTLALASGIGGALASRHTAATLILERL